MAIDTSIYQNLLRPPKSVAELDAEAMSGQMNKLQLQGAQQQMADRQIARDRQNQLRALVGGFGADDAANVQALRQGGFLEEAQGYSKQVADIAKTRAEARAKEVDIDKTNLANLMTKQSALVQLASSAKDQRSWDSALQMAQAIGVDISSFPKVYDPVTVSDLQTKAQTVEQRLADEWKKREFDLKASNELIMPGGKINQPLLGAKRAIAEAGKTSVNVNTDNLGLKPKDRFEMEGKLASDFKGATKLDDLIVQSTSKIKTALAQPGAIKDQAAIYSFAKMLDPEGAVRESDYAAIANTAGLMDRARSAYNKLVSGEMLSAGQRKDMENLANAFEGVAKNRIAKAQSDYAEQAGRYNLRPEAVIGGARVAKPDQNGAPGAAQSGNIDELLKKYGSGG